MAHATTSLATGRLILMIFLAFTSWESSARANGLDDSKPSQSPVSRFNPEATSVSDLPPPGSGPLADRLEMTPINLARETAAELKRLNHRIELAWLLIAAFLILLMQAGFALQNAGLCRAKNAAHTMAMLLGIFAVGTIGYWACGFAFQTGGMGWLTPMEMGPRGANLVEVSVLGKSFGVIGLGGFFLSGLSHQANGLGLFLIQVLYLGVAAAIPTGAMAERWRSVAFVVYGLFVSTVLYPVYACWVWGGGWLARLGDAFGLGNGFVDFAGSGVVHMTGGVIALAGALVLGPRIGKFREGGKANPIPGHNIPMVIQGSLILAFGWLGFNTANPMVGINDQLINVAACTLLAAASGCTTASLTIWLAFGKPDPTVGCNGLLAGLVAVSASCAFVNPGGAVIIGGIAGLVVVWSMFYVERILKVDDPVGAVSVHGVCGALGSLCLGVFASGDYGKGWNGVPDKVPIGLFHGGGLEQLGAQCIGVLTNVAWVFPLAWLFFKLVDRTLGNRVTARDEITGLDLSELGTPAYVEEEPRDLERAGQDQLGTYGPGVPARTWHEGPTDDGISTPTAV